MMAKTHALAGVTATSLIAGTVDPVYLTLAAVASQLPDADSSKSYVGRLLWPISRLFETHFPHRTITHSFLATAVVALLALPLRFSWPMAWKAVVWGFFFGWFADVFTKSGVAAFYPLTTARLVVPGNPALRLATGSKGEFGVLALLVVLLAVSVQINTAGGVMRVFSSALGQPESVVKLWQSDGGQRRILASVQGRYATSGAPVAGDFEVIEGQGEVLLLRGADGATYQAGKAQFCNFCQIHVDRVKGRTGSAVTISTREMRFADQKLGEVLASLKTAQGTVWLSGEVKLADSDLLSLPVSLRHYNPVTVSGDKAKTLRLRAARVEDLERVADYYGEGQLLIREVRDVR